MIVAASIFIRMDITYYLLSITYYLILYIAYYLS